MAPPVRALDGAPFSCERSVDVKETRRLDRLLARLDWEDDEDAAVLYLSIGKPRKATGGDIGQRVIVRYDEKKKEVVGLTILGMRARLVEPPRSA